MGSKLVHWVLFLNQLCSTVEHLLNTLTHSCLVLEFYSYFQQHMVCSLDLCILWEGNEREWVKRKRTTREKQLLPLFQIWFTNQDIPKSQVSRSLSARFPQKPTVSLCCEIPNVSTTFITCSSSKHLIFTGRQPLYSPSLLKMCLGAQVWKMLAWWFPETHQQSSSGAVGAPSPGECLAL